MDSSNITIQHFLDQVLIISEKYNEIELITGERFNIFSIIGRSTDELTHSTFICNLLNPKGTHGQKEIFLKLFLDVVVQSIEENEKIDSNSKFELLKKINYDKTVCITEYHIGSVTQDYETGGRIDILIKSGIKNIIIENKIYAGDQHKQLSRYHQFDNEAPIIYLSLMNNNKVGEGSSNNLKEGVDYFCISYEKEICNWLTICIQHSYSLPFIRETLRQYLNLIKRLTKQSTMNNKKEELLKLILNGENGKYVDALTDVLKLEKDLKIKFLNKIKEDIKSFEEIKLLKDKKIKLLVEKIDLKSKYSSFSIKNSKLEELEDKLGLIISFTFHSSKATDNKDLTYGFRWKTEKIKKEKKEVNKSHYTNIVNEFKKTSNIDDVIVTHKNWLCFKKVEKFNNWEDINFLKNYYFDENVREEFKAFFLEKIKSMLQITDKVNY